MSADLARVMEYLQRDVLRNIVSLKMLAVYGAALRAYALSGGSQEGVLLLLPTRVSAYDQATYPQSEYVVLPSADDPAALHTLLQYVPRDTGLVFKLNRAGQAGIVAETFSIRRCTAFQSFTAPPGSRYAPSPQVQVLEQVPEAAYPLFAAQGHARAEVDAFFAAGDGICCLLDCQGEAAAACYAVRNFGRVFEIGGVYTLPAWRRQGLARRLVVTALHSLLERGLAPRYQVHELNTPSIRLAESVGLVRFMTLEHWLHV